MGHFRSDYNSRLITLPMNILSGFYNHYSNSEFFQPFLYLRTPILHCLLILPPFQKNVDFIFFCFDYADIFEVIFVYLGKSICGEKICGDPKPQTYFNAIRGIQLSNAVVPNMGIR